MLIPLVALAVSSLMSLDTTTAMLQETSTKTVQVVLPCAQLEREVIRACEPVKSYLVNNGPQDRLPAAQRFNEAVGRVEAAFQAISASSGASGGRQPFFQSARRQWQRLHVTCEEALTLPQNRPQEQALALLGQLNKDLSSVLVHLDGALEQTEKEIEGDLVEARSTRRWALIKVSAIGFVGLVAVFLTAYLLARSVLTPVSALEEGARRFGEGDLAHRVDLPDGEELARLAVAFNRMAQKLEADKRALEQFSSQDELTGLANYRDLRRRLKDEKDRYMRYQRPFSMLIAGVDGFKAVNEHYGHLGGDEVLRSLARVFRNSVRPVDTVARYGGDEIAVLMPETSEDRALTVAERLRHAAEGYANHLSDGSTIVVTVSVGTATFGPGAKTEDEMVSAADRALRAAKNAGRNQVCQAPAA
jgi:diguanylate cyclase (GGDEF)-like protein